MPPWTSRHGCPGHLWRALGQEISENLPALAGKLGQSEYIFQVPSGSAQADLHHQRHRGFQPSAAQGDQGQIGVSHGRQPAENVGSGDDGHHEKVDGTAAGLEGDPRTAVHLFCQAHARITPPGPDVKGETNGFATLDIPLRRRYAVDKAADGQAAAAPY